jgi:hypothetical protein
VLPVSITKQQVKDSPDIAVDPPLSRDQQIDYHNFFRWPFDWGGGGLGNQTMVGVAPEAFVIGDTEVTPDPHPLPPEDRDVSLRSCRAVMGYTLSQDNEPIGKVIDFILNFDRWTLDHLIVCPEEEESGERSVLLPTDFVKQMGWKEEVVFASLPADVIWNAPVEKDSASRLEERLEDTKDYFSRLKVRL